MPVVSLLLLAALPARAGDLWFEYRVRGATEIEVELPANWLSDLSTPLTLELEGTEVDVREVARDVRGRWWGARETWRFTDDDGDDVRVRLRNRRPHRSDRVAISSVHVEVSGAEGRGLDVDIPVESRLGRAALAMTTASLSAQVQIPGVSIPWTDGGFLDQLVHSPGRTLVDISTEGGTQVRVESR